MNLSAIATAARAWLRQTSTITGIATLATAGLGWFTGAMGPEMAISIGVGAVVAIAMPGHPEVQAQVARVATDVALQAVQGHRQEAVQVLAKSLLEAIQARKAA